MKWTKVKTQYIHSFVVAFVLSTAVLHATESLQLKNATFVPGFDNQYVACQSIEANGNVLIASVRDLPSTFAAFGSTRVQLLDPHGWLRWSFDVPGVTAIGDVLQHGEISFIVGEAQESIEVLGESISAGSAFFISIDQSGTILAVRELTGYGGAHARMHVAQNNEVMLVLGSPVNSFGNNVIGEIDQSGNFTVSREFQNLLVSDIATTQSGEIYVAGMVLKRDTIDGIPVAPSFGYINMLAKFSSDLVAQWFYLSEHITVDRLHDVELLPDGIVFLALEKADPPMLLKPTISIVNDQGALLKRVQLESSQTFKSAQLATVGNTIVVAHDRHSSLGAAVVDTADVWLLDDELSVLARSEISGNLRTSPAELSSVQLSRTSGGVRVSWLCDSATAVVDGTTISTQSDHEYSYLLGTSYEVDGTTSISKTTSNKGSESFVRRSVASNSYLTLDALQPEQGLQYEVYNVNGRIHYSGVVQNNSVYVPQLPLGYYTIVVNKQRIAIVVTQ